MSTPARFLSRWSRLKREAVAEAPVLVSDPDAPLDSATDLSALLREELSDAVRKQTLKAIFADPHFNVMDGLDTYIDDYSISEPIPPAMLATLSQARCLFAADEAPGEAARETVEAAPLAGGPAVDCDNLHRRGREVAATSFVESVEQEK